MDVKGIAKALDAAYIAALPVDVGKKGFLFAKSAADYVLGLLSRLNEAERIKVAYADIDARLQEAWWRTAVEMGKIWASVFGATSDALQRGAAIGVEEHRLWAQKPLTQSLISAASRVAAADIAASVERERMAMEKQLQEQYLQEAQNFREQFGDITSRIDRLSSALTEMAVNSILTSESTDIGGYQNEANSTD